MYVNDPIELTELPVIKDAEISFEEAPDPETEFWEEAYPSLAGQEVEYHQGFYTQICRFGSDGIHIAMAKDCPHFNSVDQEGLRIQPGWTVQQNRR